MVIKKLATLLGKNVMKGQLYAFQYALLFSIIPTFEWLALSIASLVTLRKGWKPGLLIFCAPCIYQLIKLHGVPLDVLLIELLATSGCVFFASMMLRSTASWSLAVFSVFVYASVLLSAIMFYTPGLYELQLVELKQIMQRLYEAGIFQENTVNQAGLVEMVAHYLLGIQIMKLMLSSLFSLGVARAIQALLYNPGGFAKEFKHAKGHWVLPMLLIVAALGAYLNWSIATNLMPIVCGYYMILGVSASYYYIDSLSNKKMLLLASLLLAFFIPLVVMIALLLIGILDNLLKLRLYDSPSKNLGENV